MNRGMELPDLSMLWQKRLWTMWREFKFTHLPIEKFAVLKWIQQVHINTPSYIILDNRWLLKVANTNN